MPHHNLLTILLCLSAHLSSFPVRSSAHLLARPQPYLTSTQAYLHLNKLPPAYQNFHCTFTALTNSSFFTQRHTASLRGYPTQSRSHPPCKPPRLHPQHSLHAHPEYVTALNDLINNHKPDIIALTETWIRSFTTPAELIHSKPPG